MMASNAQAYDISISKAFNVFTVVQLISIGISIFLQQPLLALLPASLCGLILLIKDYRILYWLFLLAVPFSIEVQFGSIGTDLPTEPLMLLLTGIGVLHFVSRARTIDFRIAFHPIGLLILLHIIWIGFTSLFSLSITPSIKFFLAKVWYIIPFYFFTYHMISSRKDILRLLHIFINSLGVVIAFIFLRHVSMGLTFDTSYDVVRPFFRNHVNHAAIMVLALPYIWALYRISPHNKWMLGLLLFFPIAIYFSYTRAAYVAIFVAIGGYFIFKYRLTIHAIALSLVIATVGIAYMVQDNRYLEYAPNYEKTIAHYNFDNLIEATYKLEDISTMERVYRWVAGVLMVIERPLTGFGPSAFYEHYEKYTVRSFETYVSNNPEKSGIHNYYLMLAVEQGVPGLIIFLVLVFCFLLIGEKTYHATNNKDGKILIMGCLLSNLVICTLLIINDLIEVDKVGPFFFINLAIVAYFSIQNKTLKTI